jgi:hypothetical protein
VPDGAVTGEHPGASASVEESRAYWEAYWGSTSLSGPVRFVRVSAWLYPPAWAG